MDFPLRDGESGPLAFTNDLQHPELANAARYIQAVGQRLTGAGGHGVGQPVFKSMHDWLRRFGLNANDARPFRADQSQAFQL